MMLTPGWLSCASAEYSVLVLPLPVGPVTSTMPHGLRMARSNRVERLGSKPEPRHVEPQAFRSRADGGRPSRRRASAGTTRGSRSRGCLPWSLKRALMRPSCGSRFSAMSRRAMILMREMIGSRYLSAGVITACSTPSMRNRIRISFSYGSMWMSLAPSLNRREQQRVDEPDDRRFAALPSRATPRRSPPRRDDLEVVVRRAEFLERPVGQVRRLAVRAGDRPLGSCRAVVARRSRRGSRVSDATTGSTCRPVMNLMSSIAKTFVGSVIASVSVVPLRPTGMTIVLGGGLDRESSRTIAGSRSNSREVDDGHAVLAAQDRRDVFVAENAELDETRRRAGRRWRADGSAPPAVGQA